MAQKTATYYGFGDEDQCADLRQFIEDAGIHLLQRDMSKDPLSARELEGRPSASVSAGSVSNESPSAAEGYAGLPGRGLDSIEPVRADGVIEVRRRQAAADQ